MIRSSLYIPLLIMAVCTAFLGAVPDQAQAADTVYTCSMHPQVRLPAPGSCPICSMPLVLAQSSPTRDNNSDGRGPTSTARIELSEQARAMASVETVAVERKALAHIVRSVGKISYDETSLATITARVDGYAERLFVNFTGVEVAKGDHLAEIYSPELVVAQQELLVAAGASRSELLDTTRIKLRRLGLTDSQVAELLERRKVAERVTLFSPISGTVILRNITQNAAFKSGDILYQIANLDSVWGYLDIYESQLPWLRYGQHVTMVSEALPGRTFEGKVTFISPIVDEETRTIKVPVHIENKDHALKPGMFVSADIHAALDANGSAAPTGAEGSFTCPMHPQVIRESTGACPLCGMDLKRVPGIRGKGTRPAVLAVPVSAVLDSGVRKFVYVETAKGSYEGRDVTLGPRAGEYFPVLAGLAEGERVAVRGNFLLDSQAQISGSPSLFYPQGASSASSHQHGDPAVAGAARPVEEPHHAHGHAH
ncbi:MAG: efflux RND transporter periplasmic adaptor subunit [Bdellovibrionota bacterium]|nr:MAG: efflux RND transporter periplasmic adaptor subunit [Bdellovibrionota bacterium]